ncbi:hypothetical protein PIB30_066958 [Stylosanthes scabra]|uniref:Uncharacterized protein n=1 Tax=Stylosanthes scabra TaxID=79078 RepID=A0ABU6UR50_9FABA|nr:hypothetical protein [Stylosanthes scabra]
MRRSSLIFMKTQAFEEVKPLENPCSTVGSVCRITRRTATMSTVRLKTRYRLRDDEDVKLIRGGSSEAGVDTQSAGPASRNIRRMIVNLNDSPGGSNDGFNYGVDIVPPEGMLQEEFESHEGFVVGDPMTESFHLDPDQEDGRDEDEEELNSFRISQVSLAQPSISQPYEYPVHFSILNLDAINSEFCLGQGGPDDDPTTEFEVGQQFENKEEVLMAVKTYSILRGV